MTKQDHAQGKSRERQSLTTHRKPEERNTQLRTGETQQVKEAIKQEGWKHDRKRGLRRKRIAKNKMGNTN